MSPHNRSFGERVLFATLLFTSTTNHSFAADYVWDGIASSVWENGFNWGSTPAAQYPGKGNNDTATIGITASITLDDTLLSSKLEALTINIGSVSIAGTGSIATQNLTGLGSFSVPVTVTVLHQPGGGGAIGSQSFTDGLAYGSGSIFAWDVLGDGTTGVANNAGTYDQVANSSVATGSDAIFRILNADGFAGTFWDTDKTWTNIFTLGNLSAIFSGGFGGDVSATGVVTDQGSFSWTVDNTLMWTASVPEPTSALAGFLICVGFLRHRRRSTGRLTFLEE